MGGIITEAARLCQGMKPREPRRSVVIQARMRLDGVWSDVCIRNISSRGMLLQAAAAPPRGTYVEIFRGRHSVVAQVRWCKDRRFGIHTRERMDVDAIINEPRGEPRRKADSGTERRSASRLPDTLTSTAATLAARADRSRRLSATFQFCTMVGFSLVAAVMILTIVGEIVSRPFAIIAQHL